MINALNLLYSKSSAARILGLEYSDIERIEIWSKVIWVKPFNRKASMISKKVFKQHFVDIRKQRSLSLQLTEHLYNSNAFTVRNPRKDTHYTVYLVEDGLECECEDYLNQIRFIGKACCKHCYRVLNHLGHRSLAEYLNDKSIA